MILNCVSLNNYIFIKSPITFFLHYNLLHLTAVQCCSNEAAVTGAAAVSHGVSGFLVVCCYLLGYYGGFCTRQSLTLSLCILAAAKYSPLSSGCLAFRM